MINREKFNGGQIVLQPTYTPKTRPPQRGIIKSRTNADKTVRAVRMASGYWLIERLVQGDWVDVCELMQYSTGVYQIVGGKIKHKTMADALAEAEGMGV